MNSEYVCIASHPEIEPLIEKLSILKSESIDCYIDIKKDPISFTHNPENVYELFVQQVDVDQAIELISLEEKMTDLINSENPIEEVPTEENIVQQKFKIKGITLKVSLIENEILLTRKRFTFTSPFIIISFFTFIAIYLILKFPFKINNLFFYLVALLFFVGFIKQALDFAKSTVFRIDAIKKKIFKNGKIFLDFEEINTIRLTKTKDHEVHYDTYTLELIIHKKSIFFIGQTSDIALYELGGKIATITNKKIELR